jgi:hypothetical protein
VYFTAIDSESSQKDRIVSQKKKLTLADYVKLHGIEFENKILNGCHPKKIQTLPYT